MNRRLYKVLLLAATVALLAGAGVLQSALNRDRARLGLTRMEPLENAPPVLALTTQALGGFRGLIANALWICVTDLQEQGQYFEMVQLADWITKLEPHLVQVWIVQAWNMAYNISVKFSDFADRWRWVQRGIVLLRDDGLRFNPDETLIYRELAWFFQHKMGQNLDDAHVYYKAAWAQEMMEVFGGRQPDFDQLINPQTPEQAERARVLREKYKLDPARMRALNDRYGPLDWRLPEAHAIYWASLGLEKADPEELITLRRVIYQSMNLSFQRGKLVLSTNLPPRLMPNLDIIPKVDAAFEEQIALEEQEHLKDAIRRAHRNFLREVPFQLFLQNRIREGERWMQIARQKYSNSIPAGVSLAEYAVNRAMSGVESQTHAKVTALLHGFVTQFYFALLDDRLDEANAYLDRARELREAYTTRTRGSERLALPTIAEMRRLVESDLLDPERGLAPEARARLRTVLQLPPETAPAVPPPTP